MKIKHKIEQFIEDTLAFWIIAMAVSVCVVFLIIGTKSENGSITLNGKDAVISDELRQIMDEYDSELWRIMNEDKPTDDVVSAVFNEPAGQGFYTTLADVLVRRKPDGFNDNGLGLQCSKYTGYLATGRMEYSTTHPDYGPVNGKDVAAWLVRNYGFKYIDEPVQGAIGSGGFNTLYGHTAMFLYRTGANTAMVNDANFVPLTVATHDMNIDGWVWVVPGSYEPTPEPSPTPSPVPSGGEITYTYVLGDYFSKVLIKLGLDEGNLWGEHGAVKYYTGQLIEQNMLDYRGNVKVGIPFTLIKR